MDILCDFNIKSNKIQISKTIFPREKDRKML